MIIPKEVREAIEALRFNRDVNKVSLGYAADTLLDWALEQASEPELSRYEWRLMDHIHRGVCFSPVQLDDDRSRETFAELLKRGFVREETAMLHLTNKGIAALYAAMQEE